MMINFLSLYENFYYNTLRYFSTSLNVFVDIADGYLDFYWWRCFVTFCRDIREGFLHQWKNNALIRKENRND